MAKRELDPVEAVRPGAYYWGTRHADVIRGTGGIEFLIGRGGDDRLCGVDGRDRFTGKGGQDRMLGGGGDDRFYAEDGEKDLVDCGENPGDNDVVEEHDEGLGVLRGCEDVR